MLYNPEFQDAATPVAPDRPVRTMTGRRFNNLIKWASATACALLASRLAQGVVQILRPTYRQAAALTRVSASYVATVGRLTQEEGLQLACGLLSLPRLHNRRQNPSDAELDRVVERYGAEALWRALDRAELDRVVECYGAEALWRALDRATAPSNLNGS
jgi:hypothetical protein